MEVLEIKYIHVFFFYVIPTFSLEKPLRNFFRASCRAVQLLGFLSRCLGENDKKPLLWEFFRDALVLS